MLFFPFNDPNKNLNSSISYEFRNTIQQSCAGLFFVTAQVLQPLGKYELSFDLVSQSKLDSLESFWRTVKGQADAFLFRDPIDYYATKTILDTTLGITTQGIVIQNGSEFQLGKRYKLGSYYVDRPVNHVVEGEIEVFDGITPATVTIDYETGKITSGGSLTLTWEGIFYIACRFENAELPKIVEIYNPNTGESRYEIPSLFLKEVRERSLTPSFNLSQSYLHEFAEADTMEYRVDVGRESKTDIFDGSSGYEDRTSFNSDKIRINCVEANISRYSRVRKEYYLGLWRVCLGDFATLKINLSQENINTSFRFKEGLKFTPLLHDLASNSYAFSYSGLSFIEDTDGERRAYCQLWKFTRKDGTIIGFTNHDQYIFYAGDTYSPDIGFINSSKRTSLEINKDNTEMKATLKTDLINEEDLVTGKYRDAKIEIFLYNWFTNSIVMTLFIGSFQQYSIGYILDGAKEYNISAVTFSDKFDSIDVTKWQSKCPHVFLSQGAAGKACNAVINSDKRKSDATTVVTGILSESQLQVGSGLDNWIGFKSGVLKFVDGLLIDQEYLIADASGLNITLSLPLPISPVTGTQLSLDKPCGKSLSDCHSFSNAVNFGGIYSANRNVAIKGGGR